ncbi:MAG: hypothetical protein IPP64_00305 [Bacteroidetes bacterium]|nr:hypothetical protein [Bacteroidota bacterium]
MNTLSKSFYLKLAIFSVFTLGILFLWKGYASARFQSDLLLALWVFFIVTTAGIHYLLTSVSEKEPKRFVGYFMGITAMKLFGYLIIIVIYALLKKEAALGFTLWFLTLYLLYSGFEVVMLMKHFKK